ncbi:electron transport complex subunit RsxG [Glaciecola siphonariae]|uniref:Ion-translocating oxidoreductase complex subunit G n=1 Tax=Glaciecola siphonariae TaxID=521012 RepID=A0ABV9LUC0_9ALTE
MMKYISKNGAILAGFAFVSTALIALTFYATKDKIALAKEQQLMSVLNELVPESQHDNLLHTDCIVVAPDPLLGDQKQRIFRATNDGKPIAAIIETTSPNGYSGDIDLVVAVSPEQVVLGTRIIDHKETPGLGDKIDIRVSDWIKSFNNVPYSEANEQRWQVKKDGGQFDQFTGATITPRAVVNAVKDAAIYLGQHQTQIFEREANCSSGDMRMEIADE